MAVRQDGQFSSISVAVVGASSILLERYLQSVTVSLSDSTSSADASKMAEKAFSPSPEQKKVIAHRGGHLQVIACAGAGKTEAISRRVCSLIEEGVEPCQIVAFTFTERAAESLKTRITRRVAEVELGGGCGETAGLVRPGVVLRPQRP